MSGFGHAATRVLIAEATGVAPSLPKTTGTGCGRRRPVVMASTIPGRVTCPACRERARTEYLTRGGTAAAAARIAGEMPRAVVAVKAAPAGLRAEERTYRELAARFA